MKKFILSSLILFLLIPAAMAQIEAQVENGILRYFNTSNYETVDVIGAVYKYDDFTGPEAVITSVTGAWNFTAVNSGTWTLTPATGGLSRITTGAADNDDAELTSELTWSPGKYCAMEARVRINDPTVAFNVGFNDATNEAADTLALDYATVTLTSNSTDCALFFADYDATTNLIRCAAVDSDTDGTVTSTGTTFAEDTWYIFRVEINEDGDCTFWFNGNSIYTETTGISTDVSLCAYIGLINREGTAQTMDVDYIRVWQKR